MDFFTETKQKIKAIKEIAKHKVKPLTIVAAVGVSCGFTSCQEYQTYNSTKVTYVDPYSGARVQQIRGGSLRDITRSIKDTTSSIRNLSSAARDFKRAFDH